MDDKNFLRTFKLSGGLILTESQFELLRKDGKLTSIMSKYNGIYIKGDKVKE